MTNLIIRDGIVAEASEILLESGPEQGLIQYRIDGVREEQAPIPSELMAKVLRRISVLSKLFPIKPSEVQKGTARVMIRQKPYELGVTFTPSQDGPQLSISIKPVTDTESA